MRFSCVHSADELAELVSGIGILPFFTCGIPGWSLEENIDPSVWFTSQEGPWEWKGQLAREKRIVYGRFFQNKNAFVSLTCFPDLCNYRRDGYDFEGRCDDHLVPHPDKLLMSWMERNAPAVSKVARRSCGVVKGYDAALTRLQMQTFLINRDFVYDTDKHGKPYGWGNALLDTPERFLGQEIVDAAGMYKPAESLERIVRWLHGWMPDIEPDALRRALK